MRFISKYQNHRVVLKSSLPGNRQTGQQPIPGRYVKFEQGIADVNDPEDIKLMMQHPGFGNDNKADFIAQDQEEASNYSPFNNRKVETEPRHNITEIDRGAPIQSNKGEKINDNSSKEKIKEIAMQLAKEMMKEELPKAVEREVARREQEKTESEESNLSSKSVEEEAEDVNESPDPKKDYLKDTTKAKKTKGKGGRPPKKKK